MRIRNAFEEIFCLHSNVSNDDIIFAQRPGPKRGMDFRGLVWKRVWKMTFLVWNKVRTLRNGQQTPTKNIPKSTTPPQNEAKSKTFLVKKSFNYIPWHVKILKVNGFWQLGNALLSLWAKSYAVMVFKWNLLRRTFTECLLFLMILQNEISLWGNFIDQAVRIETGLKIWQVYPKA